MRAVAIGLLTGLVLALAPATASALTCVPNTAGPLRLLESTPVSFVGEAVGHRGELTVFRVQEAFKGVAAGQEVEVRLANWGVSWYYLAPLGRVDTVVAGYGADGILRTQLCIGASADGLRAAVAAEGEGRRCGSDVASVRARSVRGRLSLRIAVHDLGAWGERVEVRWGRVRRTYALPPAASKGASWRRLEVSRWFGPPGRVLVGLSVVRSELSRVLCGGDDPRMRRFAERTLWRTIR